LLSFQKKQSVAVVNCGTRRLYAQRCKNRHKSPGSIFGLFSFGIASSLWISGVWAKPIQVTRSNSSSSKIQQTVKVKKADLKAQLQSCVRQEQSVQCVFFLSSVKNDLAIWVAHPNRAKSRLVDQEGNEYGVFQIIRFGVPDIGTMIVRKAPIRLVIQFDQLPPSLTQAVLVEIGLETYGRELPVRFQNVNLPSGVFQFQPPPPEENPGSGAMPPSPQPPNAPAPDQPSEEGAGEEAADEAP
jgi:hypothetical protein